MRKVAKRRYRKWQIRTVEPGVYDIYTPDGRYYGTKPNIQEAKDLINIYTEPWANPSSRVHPQAIESLKRYREDLKAGHLTAAEYWRGQAGAYFTANPSGVKVHFGGGSLRRMLCGQPTHTHLPYTRDPSKVTCRKCKKIISNLIRGRNPILSTLGTYMLGGVGLYAGIQAAKWGHEKIKERVSKNPHLVPKGKGEYYADYDEKTGLWCIFHTENGHAYASYSDKYEAERRAKELNQHYKLGRFSKNPTLKIPIKSDRQLEHLFKAQSQLTKAGVHFDSGTQLISPKERHWELDYSLRGAKLVNPPKHCAPKQFGSETYYYAGKTMFRDKLDRAISDLKRLGVKCRHSIRSRSYGYMLWTSKPTAVHFEMM